MRDWRAGNRNAKTHGMSASRFARIYYSIRNRCNNSGCSNYAYYGGRGIRCEWDTFEQFRDDMADDYAIHVLAYGEKDTTIDRIDNGGNYCKANCRWATRQEQVSHQRSNRNITYAGATMTLAEWARSLGIPRTRLRDRLRLGWTIEEALTTSKQVNQFV